MSRVLAAAILAAPQPGDYDPSTGQGPEWGKAAPIGLLVILLLGVAVFFLLRSFTHQLKKVPDSFPEPEGEPSGRSPTGRVVVPTDPAAGGTRGGPAPRGDGRSG